MIGPLLADVMTRGLHEIPRIRQDKDSALKRRWFTCESADLFVWAAASGEIERFEFSYDKSHEERALHWTRAGGLSHWRIDDYGRSMASPMAVSVRDPEPLDNIASRLETLAAEIEPHVLRAVLGHIRAAA